MILKGDFAISEMVFNDRMSSRQHVLTLMLKDTLSVKCKWQSTVFNMSQIKVRYFVSIIERFGKIYAPNC